MIEAFDRLLPNHYRNLHKDCSCTFCVNAITIANAEVKAYQNQAQRMEIKPVVGKNALPILPSASLDYASIFGKAKDKLQTEFKIQDIASGDDEKIELIRQALIERTSQLEAAIEELRIIKQATSSYYDDVKEKFSSAKKAKISAEDMSYRQAKQQQKIDRNVNLNQLQRKMLISACTAACMTKDQINTILKQKGFEAI